MEGSGSLGFVGPRALGAPLCSAPPSATLQAFLFLVDLSVSCIMFHISWTLDSYVSSGIIYPDLKVLFQLRQASLVSVYTYAFI